ncbi:hypothetical protein, partial [Streptomyces sp. NPDC058398]|uniref:hypothetical protein n=1 Tax=Streptomyces sp. NPDC058398 TaxID=3346479 RepID=UPI00364F5BC9
MFGRLPHVSKRRLMRTAIPVTAAALLLGLLPAQAALAVPPDPVTAETGRETLDLAELERDLPIPGKPFSRHLDTLRA